MSLIQQTNFSNVVSPNGNSGLSKVQSPIQLVGRNSFTATEERAFFVEGGDFMLKVPETAFASAFPFYVPTQSRYRFITTTSTQGTQCNFREVTIMVQGSNASAIEYGIYLIPLTPTNVSTGGGIMSSLLFSETLTTSSSGVVIDTYDFTSEAEALNKTPLGYVMFPYIKNPNGANTLTLVNYTLY
jgi:hypothetical protein